MYQIYNRPTFDDLYKSIFHIYRFNIEGIYKGSIINATPVSTIFLFHQNNMLPQLLKHTALKSEWYTYLLWSNIKTFATLKLIFFEKSTPYATTWRKKIVFPHR